MWGRQWIVLGLFAGCADFAGIGDPKPLVPDAPDAPVTPCAFGGLDLCLYASPTRDITIDDDFRIYTDRDCSIVLFVPPEPTLCVVYGRTITISATLRAGGLPPLVLAAMESITITGTLDMSSYSQGETAAGANDASCVPTSSSAASAGGSFNGKGGDGGDDPNGPAGDVARPTVAVPTRIRGGCRGGGSFGGASGGAVWLASAGTITVTSSGRVLANGAGADSFPFGPGGGGGGSGGYIRMAAPSLRIDGLMVANGGGGAEGGNGGDGSDGLLSSMPAPGGFGGGPEGNGGTGGAGTTPDGGDGGDGNAADVQGGGGGGGVGFVHLIGATIDTAVGTISPPPTLQ